MAEPTVFDSFLRKAMKPAVAFIRPGPISALAALYMAIGTFYFLYGLAGSFDADAYAVGELLLPGRATRLLVIGFGGGLAAVGWGFWNLQSWAWILFVSATWVGLGLDLLWLGATLLHGAVFVGYLVRLVVDGALLGYVYRQRNFFIN